jgi:hypothetical protein
MFPLRLVCLWIFAGCVTMPSLRAALFTINPLEDAFVTSFAGSPNRTGNNYGAAGAIGVAAAGKPKGEFKSLLKFDLAGAKASFDSTFGVGKWTLDGLQLQLGPTNPNNGAFNGSELVPVANTAGQVLVRWVQNDSWAEGAGTPNLPTTSDLTWNTLASFLSANDQALGGFAFAGGTPGAVTNYPLSPSSGLTGDALAGGLTTLQLLPGDSNIAVMFNSRTGTNVPVLTLSAVAIPEPGTLALGFLAGPALLGWRHVRRRQTLG